MDERLYAFETVQANIRTLILEARKNQVEVVYVGHDDGLGTGFLKRDNEFEIFGVFALMAVESIFDNTVNSVLHDIT